MKTLDRYLIRETIPPFLLALAVLTFLFAVSPMMIRAEELLAKGASLGTVAYLLANLLPQALGVTLPMALLIGQLIALGRLSADRESVAFLACGVSLWRLLRPMLMFSAVIALATLYVMIEGIPAGNKAFVKTAASVIAEKTAQDVKPGVFYEGFPGKVLYVGAVKPNGTWERVMLATTRDNGLPMVVTADEGQLIIDRATNRVEIILRGYSKRIPGAEPGIYERADGQGPGQEEQYSIDPKQVFTDVQIMGGPNEMTIAELKVEEAWEIANKLPTHPTDIAFQQKFSFPVACFVMGLLSIAVGVHTRKDGKFAAFALGLALIFVYHGLLQTFWSLAKAQQFSAVWCRWIPNLVLGPAAIAVIWWRSKNAERSVELKLPNFIAKRFAKPAASSTQTAKPVVVIRLPEIFFVRPRLIDLYVVRQYMQVIWLAFVGLLGLFYIGTVIDLSDKLFKQKISTGTLIDYLWYSTPQFICYVIPISILVAVLVTIGSLAKTSELTVLRACGVSLYRLAAPLLLFATLWSGALFGIEEYILADFNRKQVALDNMIRGKAATTIDIVNRHWLVGTNDRVYYYDGYDVQRRSFVNLSVYELAREPYRVTRHTFAEKARATKTAWAANTGWTQVFPDAGSTQRVDFTAKSLKLEPPKYFETEHDDARSMTVTQLQAYVAQLKKNGLTTGSLEVDLQRKIAFPLMAIVMTLLAVPFGVTTGKRGALYGIGLAIVLAFAYQIAFTAFGFLGSAALLPPVLAAWAPNLLFMSGALYGLLTVRT